MIKIHSPYNKFKGKLREKGLTYADVAKVLCISETSVNHKINGISDFYISEVKEISKAFNINKDIFFAN